MSGLSRRLVCTLAIIGLYTLMAGSASKVLAASNRPEDTDHRIYGADIWPTYNNTFDGRRFSPLTQINPSNVGDLKEVCRYKVSNLGSFQSGLVLMDSTLYFTIDTKTIALDPANCKVRWVNVYQPEQKEAWHVNRGVAYQDGRLFRGTGDARLIALDAKTGKTLWTDVAGDPGLGEFLASAPLAWNGLVFIGVAGGDRDIRGRMMAFDALTGREVWRFYTIPMGDEKGADTWKSAGTAKRGGGGTWTSYAIDVSAGEVFVPVGNPAPDFGAHYRQGENLFTNSLVVLDAKTGALKWWYQLRPNDNHDLDYAAPPMLYVNSKGDPVVALGSKDGYVYAVDRITHKLLFKTRITTIKNDKVDPTASGITACPGVLGGVEWNGPAFDVTKRTIFVGSVDWCSTLIGTPPEYQAGQYYLGGSWKMTSSASGWLTAIDSDTGEVRWRYHADGPVIAGVTPTAGGVVFTGDDVGNFLVFDSATGKLLRKTPTGGAMAGGVLTYQLAGRQYVAFTSGNVSRTTFGVAGTPTIVIMSTGGAAASAAQTNEQTALLTSPRPLVAGNRNHGSALYQQACVACHGHDGASVPGYDLKTLKSRKNYDQTIAWLKDPAPPMPKFYPAQLSEQDLKDLAAFLQKF